MSSPLEFIRHGIEEADWSLVAKGFSMMTGETVKSPKGSSGMMDILKLRKQLIDAVDKVLGNPADADWTSHEGMPEDEDDDDDDEDADEEDDEAIDPLPSSAELPESSLDETPAQTAELAEAPVKPARRKIKSAAEPGSPKALLAEDEPWKKFQTEPGEVKNEKGRLAKAQPVGKMGKNTWHDDLTLATEDIRDSKRLSRKRKGKQKDVRPPVQKVKVQCAACGLKEEVEPILVPRAVDKDDDTPKYRCNKCICKGRS